MTGEELTAIRLAIGWGISVFARRCGLGQITAEKALKGQRPVPPELEAWLRWLAVTIRDNPAPDFQRARRNHTDKGKDGGPQRDYRAVRIPAGPTMGRSDRVRYAGFAARAEARAAKAAKEREIQQARLSLIATPPDAPSLAAGRTPQPPAPVRMTVDEEEERRTLQRDAVERAKMQAERDQGLRW